MDEKKYHIGTEVYIQRPLVLGQWREINRVLRDVAIPAEITPAALVSALGDNLFILLAIILTEEGKPLRGKDLPRLADDIEYSITADVAIEAMADFFALNPIPSLLRAIETLLAGQIRTWMGTTDGIGSTNSASSSATETLPGAGGSNGTSPSPTPAPGPNAPSGTDGNG